MNVPDYLWNDHHPKRDIISTAQMIQGIEERFQCEEITASIIMLIIALYDVHDMLPE